MLTRPYQMGSRLALMVCADNLRTLWRNPRDPFARGYFQGEEFERWFVTDPRIILREAADHAKLKAVIRQIRLKRPESVPNLLSRADEIQIVDRQTGRPMTIVCAKCGKTVPRTNSRQKYCPDCRAQITLSQKLAKLDLARKAYKAQLAREPDHICPACGKPFRISGARQIYCKACAADRRRAKAREYKQKQREKERGK
ncbi:hypothetical protein [uncultured Acidaminococcus sp.]|uniref:hypothetical protein n=1 Tax=uncultured Acidaminococcus sp. TaxID=352152 RepID=UPI0026DB8C15|nr:hypothetical protein [uncultured Acidaminococcus sp.]